MTLAQIANFVRVIELQSMSKAAAMIRLAQPALSRQIRALEDELGTPLLVRHGWGVTPTPAGEAFAVEAHKVIKAVEAARDTVHAHAAEPVGRVMMGMPMSLAPALLPPLTAALRERYPALRGHFIDGAGLELHKRLLDGELDLAVLYDDRGLGPVITTPLLTERLVLAGPPDAQIDASLSSGALVRSLPLILPSRPNRHRLLVEQLAGGGQANVVLEVEANAAILAMVEAGQGYTVTTYSGIAAQVAKGYARVFPLKEPEAWRTLVVARLLGRHQTTASAAVEAEMHRLIKALGEKMRWHEVTSRALVSPHAHSA